MNYKEEMFLQLTKAISSVDLQHNLTEIFKNTYGYEKNFQIGFVVDGISNYFQFYQNQQLGFNMIAIF